MQNNNSYFVPDSDAIILKEDWGQFNAKCLICQYLASLDGYICYNCTILCCKDHCEKFTTTENPRQAEDYHPYGFKLCVHCKKYSMVRTKRVPSVYDQISRFKVPDCSEPGCDRKDLYYPQMYQHEQVCTGMVSESLDPVKVELIPYFHKEGDKISLLDTSHFD